MMKTKLYLVFLLALLPAVGHAAEWSDQSKIERIYARADGSVYVDFSGRQSNPEFCANTGYYFLDKSTPGFDRIYSLLLAIKYNESDAKVYVSGCAANYPKIQHVMGY
jgi:hypothetical protein